VNLIVVNYKLLIILINFYYYLGCSNRFIIKYYAQ